jgi:hypothetical protein
VFIEDQLGKEEDGGCIVRVLGKRKAMVSTKPKIGCPERETKRKLTLR